MTPPNDTDSCQEGVISRRTLTTIALTKIAINIQYRIAYPFLPAISRGLGVPLETASLLIGARALIAATSPLYGALADRFGRRAVMLLGVSALLAGALALGAGPTYACAMAAFLLFGLSKASYDPTVQAYIGDTVPYAKRGRLLGLLELTWAASWLVGVPLAGVMIARYGWRSPFWFVGVLSLISLVLTWRTCREFRQTGQAPAPAGVAAGTTTGRHAFGVRRRPIWATRNVACALIVSLLMIAANENLFIVFGAWMENQFALSVTTLGAASSVIAIAEFVAETTSAGIVDRLGKRRATMIGLAASLGAYLLLPVVAQSLAGALGGVMLMFLTFEFGTVSMLPMTSELVPEARGMVMSLVAAAMAAGRTIGSIMGPRVWDAGGLALNTLVSAAIVMVAMFVLWRGVRERSILLGDGPAPLS